MLAFTYCISIKLGMEANFPLTIAYHFTPTLRCESPRFLKKTHFNFEYVSTNSACMLCYAVLRYVYM